MKKTATEPETAGFFERAYTSQMASGSHIGGSLLPSSAPHIRPPLPYKDGHLQIVMDRTEDTHRLIFHNDQAAVVLAEHSNGHSCHALARRIVTGGDWEAQARDIVNCGGKVDCAALGMERYTSPYRK